MGALAGFLKAILEAVLPFLFNRKATHAEDSKQADYSLRQHLADRMRDADDAGTEDGAGGPDSVGGGGGDDGPE